MLSQFTIVVAVSYLLGSIPFGYILVRLFRGEDVRRAGSGNIGATNVARKSPALGLATLVLDALKGYAAVVFALSLASSFTQQAAPASSGAQVQPFMMVYLDTAIHYSYLLAALAAVTAILGHMYPVWLKFTGGKGVATGVGAFLALAPKAVGVVLIIFVIVVGLSRYVSLGSIAATAAFPIVVWILYRYQTGPQFIAAVLVAAALIIYRHKANIRRLLSGTEHRLELKRGAKA